MEGLIPAPTDPADWAHWREQLRHWRTSTRYLMRFDDSRYHLPEFEWIPRTFTLAFVMMNDLLFYDGDYRLDAFLEHGAREFGGYDALILWHAYPRLGFDARNQFDFYRDMPGGLPRLRALVDACHVRNVRVYINYNPWDTGTRREAVSDHEALVELVQALDLDAVFLDTMNNAAERLRDKLDAVRPGVTLESEMLVPLEALSTHPSSWAQGFKDAPGVLRNKWFERRHMQHRIRRWQHDHTPELHTAWLNGAGMVVWENVFGTPVHWNDRDKSILRSMVGIQRHFADLLCGEGWTPLVETLNASVYASLWEDGTTRLWTLANSSDETISGNLLSVPQSGNIWHYDLISGTRIAPPVVDGQAILSGSLRPRGIAAFLAIEMPDIPYTISPSFLELLSQQSALNPSVNFDPTPPRVAQQLRPAPKTQPYTQPPENMVALPAHTFEMSVTFTVRECGFYDVEGVEFPNLRYVSLHRPFSLSRTAHIAPFALDITPVTNCQFADFLVATGYTLQHPERFLAHWQNGQFPPALADHPVVYVSLEDARAYAAWAGKRLPTEEEWQFAAQGEDQRRYPWGDEFDEQFCNNGQFGTTTPVTHFPQGRTPSGIYDLCGNVWEWTESERNDGRSRFAILKGGSFYRALGSEWYADGGAQPNDHAAKFLLMYPGLDRCATIGFRCAVDIG